MPVYEFRCENCGIDFETYQSFDAVPLTDCTECSCAGSLKKVIFPPRIFAKQEPTTLGHQASRNTESMGHYELQEKRHEHDLAGLRARRELGPKPERPFWRPHTDKINTDLASLAPKCVFKNGKVVESEPLSPAALDYIVEGKVK